MALRLSLILSKLQSFVQKDLVKKKIEGKQQQQ